MNFYKDSVQQNNQVNFYELGRSVYSKMSKKKFDEALRNLKASKDVNAFKTDAKTIANDQKNESQAIVELTSPTTMQSSAGLFCKIFS